MAGASPPGCRMASRTTLNAANLEGLGARRLAELLIEICAGNTAVRRRLRLELAAAESAEEVARVVRDRLATIGRSRASLDWRKRRDLAADLELHRKAIVERVADTAEALELMWQLTELANPTLARCDDMDGTLMGVFCAGVENLGAIAFDAATDPRKLADRAFEAAIRNHYGQYNDLVGVLAPALGQEGLERLKQRTIEYSKAPLARPAGGRRSTTEQQSSGTVDEDEFDKKVRRATARLILQAVADAEGDVDAFIAQHDEGARKVPVFAARIGRRLLAAGRAEEALEALDAAGRGGHSDPIWHEFDWEDARIDALETLGRRDEAQTMRWRCFELCLSETHLRAYLKRLPDFEDMEAEERALDHALGFEDRLEALSFLLAWPALDRASRLVIERTQDIDGAMHEVLVPAADALAAKYPLAATLVLRAMIEFTLGSGRSKRYDRAARQLTDCSALSSNVGDFGELETHEAFETRLRREHGRKESFWSLMG